MAAANRCVDNIALILWPTSDNGSYVAHGLALLNEIRTWCVVRQGGVPGTGIIGTGEEGCVYGSGTAAEQLSVALSHGRVTKRK
jgi:hypothetical protein